MICCLPRQLPPFQCGCEMGNTYTSRSRVIAQFIVDVCMIRCVLRIVVEKGNLFVKIIHSFIFKLKNAEKRQVLSAIL